MSQLRSGPITPRAEDFSRWYQDVVRQGQLAEAAEVVKGCMVIRPHGYRIWELMQADLDRRFKATGHQNAAFPLLIPESFLKREAEHVEGFAPELAVVTHAGGKQLEEPYVIRPTSETIIGHFFSRWIESWRDLPLLINQWGNVLRWELRTRLFLRTSEFLWQEGHTAHASEQEAREEVTRMLGVYADFTRQTLALPSVAGTKTESEKFAGARQSRCIEALMQDGRALQVATSHDLGQNFARAFDIKFQNPAGQTEHVWQTSWGSSTRLVGATIMCHGDDRGLVLPPKVAPVQAVVVPIVGRDIAMGTLAEAGSRLVAALGDAGVAAQLDDRPLKPGAKFFAWEQKGLPVRLELGPRDLAARQVVLKDRLGGAPLSVAWDALPSVVPRVLDELQARMLAAAEARLAAGTTVVDRWADFEACFAAGKSRFVLAHWDGEAATEAEIKSRTRATIRCLPDAPVPGVPGQGGTGACVLSGRPSAGRVLFAKAY